MNRIIAGGLVSLALVAGCRGAEIRNDAGPAPAAVMPATGDHLPVGTPITGRLDQTLSTDGSQVGDHFTVTVTRPVVARNGEVAIPAGATIHGTITQMETSTGPGDVAYLRLRFDQLSMNGRSYPFAADVVGTDVDVAADGGFRARDAVRGAIAGAVLGTVLDRDLDSAITGGAIGAAVGTAISLGTRRVDAALPGGTMIELRSTQAVDLR